MYTLTIIIHVVVCFLMIAAILLQGGKGAEIGAAFGGSSQTVFGSRGPTNFLSKVTIAAAVIFMLTSLSLAYLSRQNTYSSTVIELNEQESSSAPSAPSDAPPQESTSQESSSTSMEETSTAPATP